MAQIKLKREKTIKTLGRIDTLYKENNLIPPHVKEFLRYANNDPEAFWNEALEKASDDIYWFKKWDKVYEDDYPTYKWFSGGSDQYQL